MKHLLLSLMILTCLASCKKELDKLNTNPNTATTDESGVNYVDNVSSLEAEYIFPFETYYSQIDTSINQASYDLPVYALVDEGDSVQVTWNTNGLTPILFNYLKQWQPSIQKWKVTSSLQFNRNSTGGRRRIDRTVKFLKSGIAVTRSTTINITKTTKTLDFGRVNFGMSKEEVKDNELKKFIDKYGEEFFTKWNEITPSIAYIGRTSFLHVGSYPFTCYEFSEGKLIKISEVTDPDIGIDVQGQYAKSIKQIAEKLGYVGNFLKPVSGAVEVYNLELPKSWVKNGFKYTIQRRNYPLNNGTSISRVGISIEKL